MRQARSGMTAGDLLNVANADEIDETCMTFLKQIRGTAPYFQARRQELFNLLRMRGMSVLLPPVPCSFATVHPQACPLGLSLSVRMILGGLISSWH